MSDSTPVSSKSLGLVSNSVFLNDKQKNTPIIYVEGLSDYRLLERFCGYKKCNIRDCNGKEKAIHSITISNRNNRKGEFAVVDKDFDQILNLLSTEDNLFYTDTHDSETLMLSSDIFDNLLYEYADMEKVKKLVDDYGCSIFEIIIFICSEIGFIRLWDKKKDGVLNFNFKNRDFKHPDDHYSKRKLLNCYINEVLEFDLDNYVTDIVNDCLSIPYSEKTKTINNIINFVDTQIEEKKFDQWLICQGHDISCVIALFFSMYSREYKDKSLNTVDKVESQLRSIYSITSFKNTNLYKSIQKWQLDNPKYTIFNF